MNRESSLFRKLLIFFLVLLGVFLVGYFLFSDQSTLEEEGIILTVNGKGVSTKDFERYKQEVARDKVKEEESNISRKEINIGAIERATEITVQREYLSDNNIAVSDDEIKEQLRTLAIKEPGMETTEEFLDYQARRGYLRDEIERNIEFEIGNKKLLEKYTKEMEVPQEEIEERYDNYARRLSQVLIMDTEPPSLEGVEEGIRKNIAKELAIKKIEEEIEKRKKEAEVIILN